MVLFFVQFFSFQSLMITTLDTPPSLPTQAHNALLLEAPKLLKPPRHESRQKRIQQSTTFHASREKMDASPHTKNAPAASGLQSQQPPQPQQPMHQESRCEMSSVQILDIIFYVPKEPRGSTKIPVFIILLFYMIRRVVEPSLKSAVLQFSLS